MDGRFRYKAFISYSWKDRRPAERLLHGLETYHTPKDLIGKPGARGIVPPRLIPIFKDREEEAAGANLRGVIEGALDQSEFLIVVCSPNSAKSPWVNKEIAYFRKRRDPQHVLPYVVDGEPHASLIAGREAEECFPPALLFESSVDGTVSSEPIEAPLAADERPDGDGPRLARLKVVAAMLGVGLDALIRRDTQRRIRRARMAFGGVSAVAASLGGLALFAFDQRDEARLQRNEATTQRNEANAQRALAETARESAEKQRDTANAALDYLVSIYELANPATENPKTITALTIIERGKEKIDVDLVGEPEVQAKLLGALGSVYKNLGDIDEAERLLTRAVAVPTSSLTDRLDGELQLAGIELSRRKLDAAMARLGRVEDEIPIAVSADALTRQQAEVLTRRITEQRAYHAFVSGKADDAISLYTEAIGLIDESRPDAGKLSATLATNRGMILVARKQFAAGRADLDRARALFTKLYGANHLLTAKATHNVAFAEFEAKNYEAAIKTMSNALSVYETVLEPDHPDLANARKLYGTMLIAAAKPGRAIAPLEAAAKGFEAAYGPDYYDIGYSLVYLAVAYADAGRPVEARATIDRASVIYAKNFEPNGFDFGDLMVYRAIVLGKDGERAEAERLCASGLGILKANLGPQDPYLIEMTEKCAGAIG